MVVERNLRHHDDKGPAVGMQADRLRKADLCLVHPFGTALAGTMQEENDRPDAMLGPVLGQIDLVLVHIPIDRYTAVEEAGVEVARGSVRWKNRGNGENGNDQPACPWVSNHCRTEYRESVRNPREIRRMAPIKHMVVMPVDDRLGLFGRIGRRILFGPATNP